MAVGFTVVLGVADVDGRTAVVGTGVGVVVVGVILVIKVLA